MSLGPKTLIRFLVFVGHYNLVSDKLIRSVIAVKHNLVSDKLISKVLNINLGSKDIANYLEIFQVKNFPVFCLRQNKHFLRFNL